MASQAIPIPGDATVGNDATQTPTQSASVPIPSDATVGGTDNSASMLGPDPRVRRINQRTGQPATLEDPEGMDSIATDPELLSHSVQGAIAGAAAAGPVLIPAGAGEVAGAAKAGVNALAPAAAAGVQAVTNWAHENPMTAKLLWEGLKLFVYQHALSAGAAKVAGKVINAAPD